MVTGVQVNNMSVLTIEGPPTLYTIAVNQIQAGLRMAVSFDRAELQEVYGMVRASDSGEDILLMTKSSHDERGDVTGILKNAEQLSDHTWNFENIFIELFVITPVTLSTDDENGNTTDMPHTITIH